LSAIECAVHAAHDACRVAVHKSALMLPRPRHADF
jgi:hypothetical protein